MNGIIETVHHIDTKCSICNEDSVTEKDDKEYCYGCYMNLCYGVKRKNET